MTDLFVTHRHTWLIKSSPFAPLIYSSSKMGFSDVFATLTILSTSFQFAAAAPTAQCCDSLLKLMPVDTFMEESATYDTENTNFWSATEVLEPSCVFVPDTPEKVAQAVSLFVENDCKFSIKGGGHSAIPGAANIHDGILMPMEKLKKFEISPDGSTATVGSGYLMGDIYAGLDPANLTAMIGRYSKVGLGVALGAGVNYLVNKNGLAIDNVLNFEIVLADGSIVNANATNHPELFKALKGGNNNFGVVTAFTLQTEKTDGAIYGGVMYYPESSLDQVLDVVYDYSVRQAVDDHLTHVLPQYGYNGSTDEAINFSPVMYNKNVFELPEIMQGWTDIPHYNNTLHNRPYHDLSVELNEGFADGLVQEQRVFTVYADAQLYKDLWANFHAWCKNYQHISGFYCLHVNMPITPNTVQQGIMKGGNSLGLEEVGDRVLGAIYFGVTFNSMDDADEVLPAHDDFVESQKVLAESRGLLHRYIMLTYSGYDQPAIESYGAENVQNLLAVQAAYDPNKVFQRLVPGGQKLPSQ
ncbi:FAD-binding domain-containing protein [Hypoxylon cercidicola]|nr:FAD-binding domain-containing protein [Hypoxylon cercidicola]